MKYTVGKAKELFLRIKNDECRMVMPCESLSFLKWKK